MWVLSRSSETLFGAPEGEGVSEKFSTLVFRNFGMGTKFGQNELCMLCVSSRKWCQNLGGCMKIHFSSYFYYYY